MLVMSPLMARAIRKAARRERDAARGRLQRARFDARAAELASVIRLAFAAGATGSLFGLEGPLRHGVRSDLCLQGWRWRDADEMARDLLEEAFRRVRAVRPTWQEGQPEWNLEAGTLIERTRCARCHKPLPEGRPKFCGEICKSAHHGRLTRIREADEATAVQIAIQSD
jgi:hypothetical protein